MADGKNGHAMARDAAPGEGHAGRAPTAVKVDRRRPPRCRRTIEGPD